MLETWSIKKSRMRLTQHLNFGEQMYSTEVLDEMTKLVFMVKDQLDCSFDEACATTRIIVPEHIRLTVGNPERHWKVPPVNRREVLKRDSHTCQYCGSTKHLTLLHVIPRSKGGQHTWDNVVTACEKCNSIKSDV